MALQFRRGIAANRTANNFTPAVGEPIYETDTGKLFIGDGSTVGGVNVNSGFEVADLGDVTLTSETITNPNTYSVTSNVLTLVIDAGHPFTANQSITISGSSVTALNGSYTVTSVTTTNVVVPITGVADTASTAVTANITANIADGNVLSWDATNNYWKDIESISEVSGDTTPQLGGDLDVNGNDIISAGTNDINLDPAVGQNVVIKGNATDGSGKLVLNCENNSHGIKIKGPPHSAAANYTLTLPDALPSSAGQALTSDTSGNLTFASVGGAGTRSTGNATTASIADGASADMTITGAKSYMLMSIQTSHAAWVTVYTSTAARTADASRTSNTDPLPGSGVIAEVITGAATTQKITPGLLGFNDESTPTSDIYLKVENQSGSATEVTITLSFLTLES